MEHVVSLAELDLVDVPRAGRKAAVLAALRRAGFAVPDGFVVTVDALTAAIGGAPEPVDVAALARTGALPDGLVASLRTALAVLGDSPVAVRSSGVDEDLAGMSYAGQYESTLNVSGLDAVVAAIWDCWASASGERVAAYAGSTGTPRLAVLVQAMVPADAAGVAFHGNPVTGARDETLVSAVRGLGDRLMAGHSDADEWTVTAERPMLTSGSGDAAPADLVCRAATLAKRVSEHLGAPQDIEWAYAADDLWLLQARPITTLPPPVPAQIPIPIEVPAGFSSRNRNIDRPWTPMERSVFLPVFSAYARHIFAYTTGIVPSAHEIGGWVYVTTEPDTADAAIGRLESIAARIATDEPRRTVAYWHSTWKPAYAHAIARMHGVDLTALDDPALIAHAREVRRLFDALHDHYFQLTGAAIALLGDLGATCAEALEWTAQETLALRGGLVGDHMAAAVDIGELAARVAAHPRLRRLVADDAITIDELGAFDADIAAGFAAYLRRHGHRTMGFDLTEPTVAERPDILLSLVRAQLVRPFDVTAERATMARRVGEATERARAVLADGSDEQRTRFEAALAGSAISAPVRDEKSYYAVGAWALVRYAALELGRRLAERGAIGQANDILFLDFDDALEALADGRTRRDLIGRNRGQHAWALAHPGPPSYGTPPGAPTFGERTVSPEAQRVMRVAQWSMGVMGPPPRGDQTGGRLSGVAASSGTYCGTVRVVTSAAEFHRLRAGDVLVCPETTAQWAILFPIIGALVTDRGSLLSHPAILAREYGVPAVVATGTATRTLRDGMLVVVDGGTGQVRIVSEDPTQRMPGDVTRDGVLTLAEATA